MTPFRCEIFNKDDDKFSINELTDIHNSVADALIEAVEILTEYNIPTEENQTLVQIHEFKGEKR